MVFAFIFVKWLKTSNVKLPRGLMTYAMHLKKISLN